MFRSQGSELIILWELFGKCFHRKIRHEISLLPENLCGHPRPFRVMIADSQLLNI
ncbi:Uncharacterized protein dnm_052300 [Desulfonema magnum]|uniref:Uncharacterized protein n=1 Tax=Desulfonema magnum TaxID=45655 RepID=A0A975BPF1_9BACT|nr:Uncharacterized protein dnm_052300 [Desulfonema magnum]